MTGSAGRWDVHRCGSAKGPSPSDPPSAYPYINLTFLVIFLGGAVTIVSLEVTPDNAVRIPWLNRELPATCVLVTRYGVSCPSCGITRSVITALRGEWERSYCYHPAGLAILGMLLAQCAMRAAFLSRRYRRPALDIVVSLAMACCMAWLLNGGRADPTPHHPQTANNAPAATDQP